MSANSTLAPSPSPSPVSISAPALPAQPSLVQRFATKYSVDPAKLMNTLKATVFKGATDEQLMALMIVADQYKLNPFTKEIYAFPEKGGGIVPVVSVDGWIQIINSARGFEGMSFTDGPYNEEYFPRWMECTIHINGRMPLTVREWFEECYRDTPAWKSTGRRMLRHRAMVQCARIAFGFSGIYEEDEARRFANAVPVQEVPINAPPVKQSRVPKITQEERAKLFDKLDAEGIAIAKFNAAHGILAIEDLPAKLYESALYWIESESTPT